MSNLNQFTIPQLKKIINATGISNLIKMSVTKKALVGQMDKFLDFDGYNFTIKETNNQQFLQSDLLKKEHKTKKLKTNIQDVKSELKDAKNELQDAKNELQDIKTLVGQIKNDYTQYQDEYMKNIAKYAPREIYPKKPKKNINLKLAKNKFNKLIEQEDFGIDPEELEEVVFQKIIKPKKSK
jgi:seryl-tRNA synthetase